MPDQKGHNHIIYRQERKISDNYYYIWFFYVMTCRGNILDLAQPLDILLF